MARNINEHVYYFRNANKKEQDVTIYMYVSVFVESAQSIYKILVVYINVNSIYLLNQGLTLIRAMFNFF